MEVENEKIRNSHLDTLTTYGIMETVSKEYIRQVIEFLLANLIFASTTDGYQVLKIQPKAYAILQRATTAAYAYTATT